MFYWLRENDGEYIYDDSQDRLYEVVDNEPFKVDGSGNAFLKFHPYIECYKTSEKCSMIEKAKTSAFNLCQ